MKEIIQEILQKLFSGRFVATIATLAIWYRLAYFLPSELNASLITMVLVSYFKRNREGE